MEFGIQVRGDWDYVSSVASWAEERSFPALALPDHYLQRGDSPGRPAWDHPTQLAALAATTTRIELVSLVTPVTFRHPAVLYKMAVTIDEISGGRFTLGLGTGWMDEEFEMFGLPYPPMAERVDLLEEAMAYIRAAMTPDGKGFEGSHYRLADFDPLPTPVGLRLMAGGAGGPRARDITARYGDEYNLYACPPERFREVVEKTAALAEGYGRDPSEITWSAAGPALAARKQSDYTALLDKLSELTGRDPEHIESVYRKQSFPHGHGGQAAEMVAALAESGCQRYYLQIFGMDLKDFDTIVEAYSAF
jgi:alkanesulfonate monooxygenase SsuD/methylene tetrahydromethanopterin reductase-like flavin-dependent oxidoreductase (luciferase family)